MTPELPTESEPVKVVEGDCRDVLRGLPDGCVDAVVTDPPYELGFMGKAWDRTGVAFDPQTWTAVFRVLKPGGYMLAMGGSRTYHRLTCAIEDAGFEVRDCILWLYGTGFPKGRGCLKPSYEPIVLARKPGPRVLPLGIDDCRVPTGETIRATRNTALGVMNDDAWQPTPGVYEQHPAGRYPANLVHDGSPEVLEAFAAFGERKSGSRKSGEYKPLGFYGNAIAERPDGTERVMPALDASAGTAARFFYCAKASRAERGEGNRHPTVKPIALMRWLVRLVSAPGDTVLDPFGGSGTTGVACLAEGRRCLLVEQDAGHCETARKRAADPVDADLFAAVESN